MNEVLSDRPAGEVSMPAVARRPRLSRGQMAARILIIAIGAAALVVAVTTENFLTAENVKAVLRAAALTGIVASAMTPMTLSGNFVSLGTQQSALGTAMLLVVLVNGGLPFAIGALVVCALIILVGLVQGAFVAAGLNPVITTLAAGSIIYGLTVTINNGAKPVNLDSGPLSWGSSTVAGVPIEVIVMLVFVSLVTLFIHRTTLGRKTVLTGANRATAEISGISYLTVTLIAFVIFSIGIAVVVTLYTAGYGGVTVGSLGSLTFDSIAAIVVGGVALSGGAGSPWRSAAGAVFIAAITNMLILRNLDPQQATAFVGGAVVLLVIAQKVVAAR
jgi:ribose/xylose/arabinose/galactoside ABC-type transport system permease subunit